MSGPASFAPKARAEFLQHLRRIDDESPVAARRLQEAVDMAARRIGERPLLGRVELSLARPRFRFWSLPAYSLVLAYDAEWDPVQILRVVHTAQDLPKLLQELRL